MNTEQLGDALSAIVGPRFLLRASNELLVYNSDGLPGYRRRPRLAVFPGNRDETIAVVRLLAEAGAPYVPRGAGTGLSGGALADDVVLLGLHRLKNVISIDAENRRATVEPGVVNLAINRFAAPLVVRMPVGFFKCGDPWHSQTNEVQFVHAPGESSNNPCLPRFIGLD